MRLVGFYLNRGTFILVISFLIMATIPGVFGEQIFLALGQNAEVSQMAARLTRLQLPSIFCCGMFDLDKRWLACMRITWFPTVATIVATVLHVPLCYWFVYGLGWGVDGLAVATSLKNCVLLLTVMAIMACSENVRLAMAPIF